MTRAGRAGRPFSEGDLTKKSLLESGGSLVKLFVGERQQLRCGTQRFIELRLAEMNYGDSPAFLQPLLPSLLPSLRQSLRQSDFRIARIIDYSSTAGASR
jgi:hypothetical protein